MKIVDKKRPAIEVSAKRPAAEAVVSTIRSRNDVGNVKKGVSLLSIVQKLSQKREKASDKVIPA